MRIRTLLISLCLLLSLPVFSQARDKAEADQLIYQELTSKYETENWHPELIVMGNRLQETAEAGISVVRGDSFQVRSLRSDFYVVRQDNGWKVLNDARFPYETMTNLMLNRIETNRHQLSIRHHQYGGTKPLIVMPMQNLFDLLARHMKLYCSVTKMTGDEIRAVLVFHQQKFDYIHMLEVKTTAKQLFDEKSTLTGDLYTNIPQSNVKSIFRESKKQ